MTSLKVLLVVDVFLDVVVPFFSADVVVKDVVVEQFLSRIFVEQLVGGNVVLDAVLPIVLLDVENDVVVELCKLHALDVRFFCARCCCRSSFHILLSNFLSRSPSLMMLILPMFCWTLRTLNVERLVVHFLAVRSCCYVVIHILVANLLSTIIFLSSLSL